MERSRTIKSFAVALLAILMMATGAPAMLCVSMADCPMMEPAVEGCHGDPGERAHCAPPRVQTPDDCCSVTTAPPIDVLPLEVATTATIEGASTASALDGLVPPSFRSRSNDATASQPGPAGRSLLSLHQTLLL